MPQSSILWIIDICRIHFHYWFHLHCVHYSQIKWEMKDRLVLIFLCLAISSCSYHGGLMMSNAEFDEDSEIVNLAYGEARTIHVLGIGGLNTKTLVRDAKLDMYSVFPLKKGQAYSNLSVDFNSRFYLFWVVTYVTVTADVVNLNKDGSKNEIQEFFRIQEENKSRSLNPNDMRYQALSQDSLLYFFKYGKPDTVAIIDIPDKNKIEIQSSDSIARLESVRNLFLYEQETQFTGQDFKLQDTVIVKSFTIKEPGIVVGVNPDFVLVRSIERNVFEAYDYKSVKKYRNNQKKE